MSYAVLRCACNHEMDFTALREALRRAREQYPMTLDRAAEATGLNRATIHSVENVKREPNYQPELTTIERLVNGYGLTLSSFFEQIEGLNPPQTSGDNRRPRQDGETFTVPHAEARDPQTVLREIAAAFFRASEHANRATTKSLLAELAFVCQRACGDLGIEAPTARPSGTGGRGRH